MCTGVNYNKQHHSQGFTIVELLVVIVVIGILAAITIVSYTGMSQKATVASLASDLDSASRQLKLYQVTSSLSSYPTSLDVNNCPVPADSARCLKPSPGTSYTSYIVNTTTTPQVFCITATKGTTDYRITNDSSVTPGTCQTSGIVTSGLIMNLDAGNTASYPSPFNSTSITDLSGNNNHATLVNGVGYTSPNVNPNDASLVFDGVNDYASFSSISSNSKSEESISVTAKILGNGHILDIGSGTGGSGNYTVLTVSGTTLSYSLWNAAYFTINTTIALNTWVNIQMVHSVSTSRNELYINGSLVGSNTTYQDTSGNHSYLVVGRSSGGTLYANFNLSNYMTYNRALSSAEVTQNFNALRGRYGL